MPLIVPSNCTNIEFEPRLDADHPANGVPIPRRNTIPALMAEVESATRVLDTPAARLMTRGGDRVLRLDDVEALFASKALIVNSCRHVVRQGDKTIWLASRRVLLALPAR